MPALLSRLFSFLGFSGFVKLALQISLVIFVVNMFDVSIFEKVPEYVQTVIDKSAYFARLLALDFGFSFVVAAYVYRFVMRRLERINL